MKIVNMGQSIFLNGLFLLSFGAVRRACCLTLFPVLKKPSHNLARGTNVQGRLFRWSNFLYIRTYNPQAENQVDHGDEPWSEVSLLSGSLPTANQHDGNPHLSVLSWQTDLPQEQNLSHHYSPRSDVKVITHHWRPPTPSNINELCKGWGFTGGNTEHHHR